MKFTHLMLVFYPCLNVILNFNEVPLEILNSGLSNAMYNVDKLSYTFDEYLGLNYLNFPGTKHLHIRYCWPFLQPFKYPSCASSQ